MGGTINLKGHVLQFWEMLLNNLIDYFLIQFLCFLSLEILFFMESHTLAFQVTYLFHTFHFLKVFVVVVSVLFVFVFALLPRRSQLTF